MFNPGRWASAFVNTLAANGGDYGEGLDVFRILAAWAKKIPSEVSGRETAGRIEKIIRDVFGSSALTAAAETAVRFTVLMAGKNVMRHADAVAGEIEKIIDRMNNIVNVVIETAFPSVPDITEAVKKLTGASGVKIERKVRADLLGGYRLRIGDDIIDASIRLQLKKLQTSLASGAGDGGI